MAQNCWEFKKCGREPGGKNTDELGVCPATTDSRLNDFHHGKNSGRTCWVVTGTFSHNQAQCIFARSFGDCLKCDFYNKVKEEEYPNFKMTPLLLQQLKEKSV